MVTISYLWFSSQVQQPPAGEEMTLEQAKELAMRKARSPSFSPRYATEAKIDPYLFKKYYFIYVWSKYHPDNLLCMVNKQGKVFQLPKDFNKLILDKDLVLSRPEEVENLIEFYLRVSTIHPDDEFVLLNTAAGIPGISQENIERYKDLIQPIKLLSQDNHLWSADFFTWELVGGFLNQWQLRISKNGEISIKSREELERRLGDFQMLQ